MKRFVELFGHVDDFDWPDVSPEFEKQADKYGRLPGNPAYGKEWYFGTHSRRGNPVYRKE